MIEHAYIHIPFCLRKCKYCSFVSGENISNKKIYLTALFKEIKTRYKGERLKTLYIGGGTPSLLDVEDIKQLIDCFNIDEMAEVTIEVNPETIEFQKIIGFKNAGINRISLGIQTFNDKILSFINRGHTNRHAKNAVITIKNAGIENISIDLIYGLPYQTFEILKNDLFDAKNLNVKHISTYGLKIEQGSFFYENSPENIPDDEIQACMYNLICDFLKDFNHYEISNFALKNYESKHNLAYWQNKEYYGFGLNASGYENGVRYKNTSNFKQYIENPFLREEENFLTEKEIIENEIFLALRLKQGIDINKINAKYNFNFMEKYRKIVEKYENYGLLQKNNNSISLTKKGILLSNEIMAEFID